MEAEQKIPVAKYHLVLVSLTAGGVLLVPLERKQQLHV